VVLTLLFGFLQQPVNLFWNPADILLKVGEKMIYKVFKVLHLNNHPYFSLKFFFLILFILRFNLKCNLKAYEKG